MVKKLFIFAGGGLVSFGTPRFLIAVGMPLDKWIIVMGEWVHLHLSPEVAIWAATIMIGICLGFLGLFWPFSEQKQEKITTVNKGKKTFLSKKSIIADKGRISFDYSTDNHIVSVGSGDKEFKIGFSKASNTSIYIYNLKHKSGVNCVKVARVKDVIVGEIIRFHEYDSSSSNYTINIGEIFLAENSSGFFLQAKVVLLKDDSRGDDHDEIVFDYQINDNKNAEFIAL